MAVHEIRARVRPGPRDRGARALGPADPAQARRPHQPSDRAARDLVAPTVQLGVDLADPVDRVVSRMDVLDHCCGRRVGDGPRRGRSGPVGVVAARADLQVPADHLDPERRLVLVDERDDHRDGRSSSAAKKADAPRKIALDQRNSFTSRSSSTAIRTTRSPSPSGYSLGATMTLIPSGIDSLHHHPARDNALLNRWELLVTARREALLPAELPRYSPSHG